MHTSLCSNEAIKQKVKSEGFCRFYSIYTHTQIHMRVHRDVAGSCSLSWCDPLGSSGRTAPLKLCCSLIIELVCSIISRQACPHYTALLKLEDGAEGRKAAGEERRTELKVIWVKVQSFIALISNVSATSVQQLCHSPWVMSRCIVSALPVPLCLTFLCASGPNALKMLNQQFGWVFPKLTSLTSQENI